MRENRRVLTGRVVSTKMNKTVVVEIETRKPHRLYHRIIRRTSRYKAHDATARCTLGDMVRIEESRPISKEKHWQVIEVLVKGKVADIQPSAIGAATAEEPATGGAGA